mmetsp:Transcript_57782/g.141134  ORF Transcript_57782/g.141134 Transcript_57782/m.141134 type:complete len:870 (+) Transcript_57782:154-2763(+)
MASSSHDNETNTNPDDSVASNTNQRPSADVMNGQASSDGATATADAPAPASPSAAAGAATGSNVMSSTTSHQYYAVSPASQHQYARVQPCGGGGGGQHHQLYSQPQPQGAHNHPYYQHHRYHHPQDSATGIYYTQGQHLTPHSPNTHSQYHHPQYQHYGYRGALPPVPYGGGQRPPSQQSQYYHHPQNYSYDHTYHRQHQQQQQSYPYGYGSSPPTGTGDQPPRMMDVYSPQRQRLSRMGSNGTDNQPSPSSTNERVGADNGHFMTPPPKQPSLQATPLGEAYYGEVESDLAALSGTMETTPPSHKSVSRSPAKPIDKLTTASPHNRSVGIIKKPRSVEDPQLMTREDLSLERWFLGSLPLGLDDDKFWLSELQVFLRSNFAEVFSASDDDIAAPMHGRNKPILLGQVGVRCKHCKLLDPVERGQQYTSYPALISGIYNSVQQMFRLHLECCQSVPLDIMNRIRALKASTSNRGGRKQYWADAARRIGLVDTAEGIRFGRDPYGPLPPLTGPSVVSKEGRKKKEPPSKKQPPLPPPERELAEVKAPPPPVDTDVYIGVDGRRLVFPEDQHLISDFLFLAMEQMAPCELTEADRVGCYRNRAIGEPGLACRHCIGQAGCGRYFPATESSLSQTTTSQTILSHVLNCLRCPIEIRENIEIMKRERMQSERKKVYKPKHGGRKSFFHRLWCRIQGLPIQDDDKDDHDDDLKSKKQSKASGSPSNRNNTTLNKFDDFSPIRKARRRSTRSFGDDGDGAGENKRKVSALENTGTDTNRAAHLQEYARGDDKRRDEKEDGDDDDEPGDNMNALIKAAAIWLTEKDQAGGGGSSEGNNSLSSGGSPLRRTRGNTSKRAATGVSPKTSPRKRRKTGT